MAPVRFVLQLAQDTFLLVEPRASATLVDWSWFQFELGDPTSVSLSERVFWLIVALFLVVVVLVEIGAIHVKILVPINQNFVIKQRRPRQHGWSKQCPLFTSIYWLIGGCFSVFTKMGPDSWSILFLRWCELLRSLSFLLAHGYCGRNKLQVLPLPASSG